MDSYIGVKRVRAKPMSRWDFNILANVKIERWDFNAEERLTLEKGYLVEYQDGGKPNIEGFAGYVSWSPKDVFEKSYFIVGENDTIADVLYSSYGTARKWIRSDGGKMEERLSDTPLECQAAWRAVAETVGTLL